MFCKSEMEDVDMLEDEDDATCFGVVSLMPSSPYSLLSVRAPSTKWENSSFDGALSNRAHPMWTSSRFAPQTQELPRTTIRSSTSPCRFSLSKEGTERSELRADNTGWRTWASYRDFGTSITCCDKAMCSVGTQDRSTYNVMGKSFSEDSTRRIAFRGFNLSGTCDDYSLWTR